MLHCPECDSELFNGLSCPECGHFVPEDGPFPHEEFGICPECDMRTWQYTKSRCVRCNPTEDEKRIFTPAVIFKPTMKAPRKKNKK